MFWENSIDLTSSILYILYTIKSSFFWKFFNKSTKHFKLLNFVVAMPNYVLRKNIKQRILSEINIDIDIECDVTYDIHVYSRHYTHYEVALGISML